MRRKSGAARGEAATIVGGRDEDAGADIERIGVTVNEDVASGHEIFAETVAAPTSSIVLTDGQQCRAATGERGFEHFSAQQRAARNPAALAAGAA